MKGLTTTDKAIAGVTLGAVGYFGFLALDHHFLRLESVALGVVRELLTIPMLLVVAVMCVVAVVRLLRNRRLVNTVNVGAAATLFILNGLLWAV